MSMKKLADEAVDRLNSRMKEQVNSMCATEDEVYMTAMACRIQELEEKLIFLVDNDSINDSSIEKEVAKLLST